MAKCEHNDFHAQVNIARLEDGKGALSGYMAGINVWCLECGRPFQFLGLEPGLDLRGARVSVDGLEANIAMCPQGERPAPVDILGFNLRAGRPLDG